MPPSEHNGPEFRYEVSADDGRSPAGIAASYALFTGGNGSRFTASVVATNSEGAAPGPSTVTVPGREEAEGLAPKRVTKVYEGDGRYSVHWYPPEASAEVANYTVFWCRPNDNKDRPHQCDGDLDWRDVPGGDGGEVHHLNLLLEEDHTYQVAVATNTITSSSGIFHNNCVINDLN